MNDLLERELTGSAPAGVMLGGENYPLAYPMHAVILYKQLTGDNLCEGECWPKIAPLADPARFVACLFAGLHVYDSKSDEWKSPLTRNKIESLVDFSNVNDTCAAITRALTRFFPKAAAGKDDPSQGESALPAPATVGGNPLPSPISGPALATTSG
jgi:hypothetical protein